MTKFNVQEILKNHKVHISEDIHVTLVNTELWEHLSEPDIEMLAEPKGTSPLPPFVIRISGLEEWELKLKSTKDNVQSGHSRADFVQGENVQEDNVLSDNVKKGNVLADNFQEGNVLADNVQEGNVLADNVQEGNVLADNVQACYVQTDNVRVDTQAVNLQAVDVRAGDVQESNIRADNVQAVSFQAVYVQAVNVQAVNIQSVNVQTVNVQAGNVKTDNVQTDNVLSDNVQDGTVQANYIQKGTVQADYVQEGTVQVDNVQADYVQADVQADNVQAGNIQAAGRILYSVIIEFKQISNNRWVYSNGKWILGEPTKPSLEIAAYEENNYLMNSKTVSETEFRFADLKFSTDETSVANLSSRERLNTVILREYHKYLPTIKIFRANFMFDLLCEKELKCCQFIAVKREIIPTLLRMGEYYEQRRSAQNFKTNS